MSGVPIEGELDTELEGEGEEEGELDTDELGDGEEEGDDEGLVDGEEERELDGEEEAEEAGTLKLIHDIAPSSLLVPPVQVLEAVPAVVDVAVVKRKVPASASISTVAFAHVFATVSVAPAATARKPPPAGMTLEPVVRGAVASMSVEPFPPVVMEVSPAPVTAYTAIWFSVPNGLVLEKVTAISAVVPDVTFK